MPKKIEWTEKELIILKEFGTNTSSKEIAKKLNSKKRHHVDRKLKKLGIQKNTNITLGKFSSKENEILKNNYINFTADELMKLLPGRTKSSIKKQASQLVLKKIGSKKFLQDYFLDWFDEDLNEGKSFKDFFITSTNNSKRNKDFNKKINLRCPAVKKHVFEIGIVQAYNKFVQKGEIKCKFCINHLVHEDDIFALRFPVLSKSYSTKNLKKKNEISYFHTQQVLWECKNGHQNSRTVKNLTMKDGAIRKDYEYTEECEDCNFISVYDDKHLLQYVDLDKHSKEELKKIRRTDQKTKIWFKCSKVPTHTSERAPDDVIKSFKNDEYSCNFCSGHAVDQQSNSLEFMLRGSGIFFDKEKNKGIDPKTIYYKKQKLFYFYCSRDHSIHVKASNLFKKNKAICPECAIEDRSLKKNYPEIYQEIHPTKNPGVDKDKLSWGSQKLIWWQCSVDPNHIWERVVQKRTDNDRNSSCPMCRDKSSKSFQWRKQTVVSFVNSISNHIESLTPSEIFIIFQQTGFPKESTKANKFLNDYISGTLPKDEIEKFKENKESVLDKYFEKDDKSLEKDILDLEINTNLDEENIENNFLKDEANDFPTVTIKQVFDALEYCLRSSDQEAVDYLLASAKNKLWKKLFNIENKVKFIKEVEERETKDEYDSKVKEEFLQEYYAAAKLVIPKGYNFRVDRKITKPNLMQLRTASRVVKDRSVGNWSGTGAGKTLSAILASRVIDSKLTLVCCPNAVVKTWKEEAEQIFPGTYVQTKDFDHHNLKDPNQHKFLVLNFEAFQQQDSDDKVMELLENTNIEFVVIDEIHYAKQKDPEKMSKRKRIINSMIAKLRETNPQLAVLGMSATPVINNLQEGIGLIEMITGEKHDDLEPKISEENCMKLHQRLMTNGLRMKIPMNVSIEIKDDIEVDCSEYIDEFKALQNKWFPLNVEQITTRAKIKEILKHIKPKTLIYTHYRQDIDKFLYDEITKAGWSVGFHTGDDKSGIDDFREGTLDVLIGTSTIGTGVNGLQNVCSNLIINSMPWTNAEFEQLIGRVYRQGQKNKVNVVIPLTRAEVNGQEWSWCKSRYERIKFKKTIGDAVIDGQLPNQNIRTQAQVVQDIKKWLDRLTSGEETIIERAKIKAQFIPGDKDNIKKRIGTFGDFSKMNARWYNTSSEKLHERLSKDRVEWDHYHEMYEENRKSWTVVPMEEMIKVFSERSDYVIGDFGCGKAQIHEALKDSHEVHSFDHVAYNKNVVACDFSHTPLDNETLDHAIFCLSFMGNAIGKYLLEANRTLKLDGKIHIIEPTKTFKDIHTFEKELVGYGFGFVNINSMSERFTYIRAEKTGEIKNPNPSIKL